MRWVCLTRRQTSSPMVFRIAKAAGDSVAAAAALSRRSASQRVVWPGVARVLPGELASDGRVVTTPEAGQVIGDLDCPLVGGKQVDDQRNPPTQDGRPLRHSEEVLKARLHPRRLAPAVVALKLATPRHPHPPAA